VYRLARGREGWDQAKLTRLATPRRGAYVSDIHVDRRSRLWVTVSTLGGGHVFVSSDRGASWNDVSGDLPSIPVNAVAVDPADSDNVFLGADNGVYRSTRSGGRWTEYGDGLPNAIVGDLVLHARLRRLRVGTRNRGVWEIEL
jgi:ligand-binding sensor domain-containing protein